jgi:hypothetical protein
MYESEQVAAGLISGQIKKSYRRRKLVGVTPVMRLGTKDALTAALQQLGFSGRLNTACIERVNLTVRHGVAALARRTWATAQQSPQLLASLEWWRAYSHCVRPVLRVAGEAHAASRARRQTSGATRPPTDESSGGGESDPTMHGEGSAHLPLAAALRLRGTKAR